MARSLKAKVCPWKSSRTDRPSFSRATLTTSGTEKPDRASPTRTGMRQGREEKKSFPQFCCSGTGFHKKIYILFNFMTCLRYLIWYWIRLEWIKGDCWVFAEECTLLSFIGQVCVQIQEIWLQFLSFLIVLRQEKNKSRGNSKQSWAHKVSNSQEDYVHMWRGIEMCLFSASYIQWDFCKCVLNAGYTV